MLNYQMKKGVPELIWYFYNDAVHKKKDLIDCHFLHWERKAWFSHLGPFQAHAHTYTHIPPWFLALQCRCQFSLSPSVFSILFCPKCRKKGERERTNKRWWFCFVFVACRIRRRIYPVLSRWCDRLIYFFCFYMHYVHTSEEGEKKKGVAHPYSSLFFISEPRGLISTTPFGFFSIDSLPFPVHLCICFFSVTSLDLSLLFRRSKGSVRV